MTYEDFIKSKKYKDSKIMAIDYLYLDKYYEDGMLKYEIFRELKPTEEFSKEIKEDLVSNPTVVKNMFVVFQREVLDNQNKKLYHAIVIENSDCSFEYEDFKDFVDLMGEEYVVNMFSSIIVEYQSMITTSLVRSEDGELIDILSDTNMERAFSAAAFYILDNEKYTTPEVFRSLFPKSDIKQAFEWFLNRVKKYEEKRYGIQN